MKFAQDNLARIKEVLESAEKICSCVHNKDLKLVAFGKVVEFLLQNDSIKESVKPKKRVSSTENTGKKKEGIKTWFEELIDESFFKTPKSMKQILDELESRDHHLKNSDMQPYLRIFMKEKRLRRKKEKTADNKKTVWHYSNW